MTASSPRAARDIVALVYALRSALRSAAPVMTAELLADVADLLEVQHMRVMELEVALEPFALEGALVGELQANGAPVTIRIGQEAGRPATFAAGDLRRATDALSER